MSVTQTCRCLFSILLACALSLVMLPTTAFASNGGSDDSEKPVVLTKTNGTTSYYDSLATALTWANGGDITVRGDVNETSPLDASYAGKLVIEEGVTLNCRQLSVSASYSDGVIVENHGTINATLVSGPQGNGTLCNHGAITCDYMNAATAGPDGVGWVNNGTITLKGDSAHSTVLYSFVNNGVIHVADGVMLPVKIKVTGKSMTGSGAPILGTGISYTWNGSEWSADAIVDGAIKVIRDDAPVASVSALSDAYNFAVDGDIIQLQQDVAMDAIPVITKNITLDLNNHTLNKNGKSLQIGDPTSAPTVVLKNGTINSDPTATPILKIYNGTVTAEKLAIKADGSTDSSSVDGVEIENGHFILSADSSITAEDSAIYVRNQSVVDIYGEVTTSKADKSDVAIIGQGNDKTNPGTTINIHPGANVSAAGMAIYHPQTGILNVEGGTVIGSTAIGIRSGALCITGGTVKGTGEYVSNPSTGGGGISGNGSAIFVGSDSGYAGDVRVSVSGADTTVKSENSYAIFENMAEGSTSSVAELNISGGTFASGDGKNDISVSDEAKGRAAISGGIFSSDVSEYCAEGYKAADINGGCVVVTDTAEPVAKVGDYGFNTLNNAFAAAQNGDAIVLQKNTEVDQSIAISDGRQLTLDMNGHNVGFALLKNISIYHGGLNITGNGELYEAHPYYAPVILYGSNEDVANYTTLTVGENVTLKGWAGLFVDQLESNSNGANAYGVVATVRGTLHSIRDIYGAGGHAFYLQGIIKATSGNVPKIILDGATLNTDEGNGMYLAGYADTTIVNTSIIADTGIEIRAGKLAVDDGTTIIANGTPTSVTPNGNGSTTDGAGIAVAQHTTKLPINVTISGGTIKGFTALYESNPQSNGVEDISKVVLSVTGGNFQSVNGGTVSVYSEDKKGFISGGTFSSDPSAYVASDYVALVQNGQYEVREKSEAAAPAEVVAGVPVSDVSDIPSDSREVVKNAISAIQAVGLTGEANAEANDNTVTAAEGKTELQKANITVSDEGDVTIVVQPYLDIVAIEYSTSGDAKSMTLDITPMVRTVATTANLTEGEEIYLESEGQNTKNAVVMEEGKRLDVTTPITLSIPLPAGLVADTGNVYVQHKGYEYTAKVTGSSEGGFVATFTNPHGFSEFTISTISEAVAILGGDKYTDFQAAVDAAQNNDVIVVTDAGANRQFTATISGPASKTIAVKNNTGNSIVVTINGTKFDLENGAQGSYAYTASSVGVGGGGSASAAEEYEVTVVPSEYGKVSADPAKAEKGDEVALTVVPDAGFELEAIAVVGPDGEEVDLTANADGTYSFEMPGFDVEVEASFACDGGELCPSHGFADVDQGEWYHDAIDWAVSNEVLNGFDGTGLMMPDGEVTRAQMAQILWNVEGRPAVAEDPGFSDVADSDWFDGAVAWAASEGIFEGYDGTDSFGPDDVLAREQAAAVLMRWTEANGGDVDARADLSGYPDASSVDGWAVEYVSWAVAAGVISGVEQEDGTLLLDPLGTATRAQTAMLMMRLIEA